MTWNQIVLEIANALGAAAPRIMHIPTEFICEVAPQMTGTLKGDKAHPGVFNNSKIKRFYALQKTANVMGFQLVAKQPTTESVS